LDCEGEFCVDVLCDDLRSLSRSFEPEALVVERSEPELLVSVADFVSRLLS